MVTDTTSVEVELADDEDDNGDDGEEEEEGEDMWTPWLNRYDAYKTETTGDWEKRMLYNPVCVLGMGEYLLGV